MNQQINTSKTYMQKNILMGKISKICKGLRMPDFIKETSDENSKALSHDILLSVSESSYRGGESNVFQGTQLKRLKALIFGQEPQKHLLTRGRH